MSEPDNDGQDWVSIAEAAARLRTDESTLRRFLKRGGNAERMEGQGRERTRATRTGTRTATVYPFPLVAELVQAAKPDDLPPDEPEAKPGETQGTSQGETRGEGGEHREEAGTEAREESGQKAGSSVFITDERTRAYLALLTQQMQGRIDEQAETIADLRADKARLLLEVEYLKALPAKAEPLPETALAASHTNVAASGGEVASPATREATEGDPPDDSRSAPSWWQRLLRRY